ncbi:MAG TPA: hypothetical protein VFE32_14980 [Puia sp.]|jgi:hypothetical protein|nr:hypothetical protein [Puia sp.]
MLNLSTIELRKLIRKLLISASLVAVVGLAVASKGGGDKPKANTPLKTNFVPIRTTAGFTLKAGPAFMGSTILSTEKTPDYVSFHTLMTYQRGNTTFIMPRTYKVNPSVYMRNNSGSNLSLLDLRINMH